jgi:hypothetical protein
MEEREKGNEKAENYVLFTKEMKKDYTILAPTMLPMHFKIIMNILFHLRVPHGIA